jgi:hypothetical protein
VALLALLTCQVEGEVVVGGAAAVTKVVTQIIRVCNKDVLGIALSVTVCLSERWQCGKGFLVNIANMGTRPQV